MLVALFLYQILPSNFNSLQLKTKELLEALLGVNFGKFPKLLLVYPEFFF